MNNAIRLIHLGTWYKAYGKDALTLSEAVNYKVFFDPYTKQPAVGFPEYAIDKVEYLLIKNCVDYIIVENNKEYDDIKEEEKIIEGEFTVKYEGDYPIESFIIGETISKDAELTKRVLTANAGDIIKVNDDRVFIIEKNIEEYSN